MIIESIEPRWRDTRALAGRASASAPHRRVSGSRPWATCTKYTTTFEPCLRLPPGHEVCNHPHATVAAATRP
eukprot:365283-Chlamydomonas_euryale.AAC.2